MSNWRLCAKHCILKGRCKLLLFENRKGTGVHNGQVDWSVVSSAELRCVRHMDY